MFRALADDRQDRHDDLDARIARARAGQQRGVTSAEARAESRGWAVAIEFVGMVLVATAIGWGIDNYAGFGTRPWAMIGMLLFGFAGAIYRAAKASAQFDAVPGNDGNI